MKDLIKKILREDFDWVTDVPSYGDMRIDWEDHVLPYLTGKRPTYDEDGDIKDYGEWDDISKNERENFEPLAKHYFTRELNDIEFKDGKFMLSVSQWSDFVPMFSDCNYQGYICRHTAEAILDEDDHWEPYYDVVSDWMGQVWDSVDDKTYQTIVEHIRKHCIGDTLDMDGEEVELTNELLTSWLGEKHILGQMINEEVGSCFEDLKNSMMWTYESAYNDASRDEYWDSTHEAIKGVVGESKWVSYEGKKRDGSPITRHYLEFDVSDIFMDVIQTFYDDYCDLDYDQECELEYHNFLDNLIFLMGEELYVELLNPRVSEWPDYDKVSEYMNERLLDEIR